MNNKNLRLKTGAMVIMAGLYSAGVVAEEATGQATATVLTPLVINNITNMAFTTIASGTNGGTLIMDNAGGITSGGAGDAIVVGGGGGTPLGFDVTGESGNTVTISVSNGVLNDGGANNMALTMDAVPNLALTGGADSVAVGGTLTVAAGQAGGSYTTATGTPLTITVNYQ